MTDLGQAVSTDRTITVDCEACGMRVSVPNDAVGELYAIDFEARHARHGEDTK